MLSCQRSDSPSRNTNRWTDFLTENVHSEDAVLRPDEWPMEM